MYRMHPPCNLHSAAMSSSRTRTDHLRSAARLLVRHLLNCGALLQNRESYRSPALCMQPGHLTIQQCLWIAGNNLIIIIISVSGELSKAAAKGFTKLAPLLLLLLVRRGNSFSGIKFICCCLPGRVRGDIRYESAAQKTAA